MPPELEILREWLQIAAEDLDAARRLRQGKPPLAQSAAFHCQQAAEKALKACLEMHALRPPKTHALNELLELACQIDSQFASLDDADWLTHFAVEACYPGYELKPTPAGASDALVRAERVFQFVLDRLSSEVHP